jgi:hypothetical protein
MTALTTSTTVDIYMQFVPESQKRVVDRLRSLSSSVQVGFGTNWD